MTEDLNLQNWWMPFTANRRFKKKPRLLQKAKGVHYYDERNKPILDGCAGLWCVNLGHSRDEITEAVHKQAKELDYAPPFQMGHPKAFQCAHEVSKFMPAGLDKIFFCNSGSEAVDTAMKIALAYFQLSGKSKKNIIISRKRDYHGTNFGGTTVAGIPNNRTLWDKNLVSTPFLKDTMDPDQRFSQGLYNKGDDLADELEAMIAQHGAEKIAAVIVEPFAGSTGVLVPSKGYLQKLNKICKAHGILLIFDEVVTAFGRLGKSTAAEYFDVVPDLITMAKGITNAVVPMGAVACKDTLYDAFMNAPENAIELFHGYTYSGHPLACAASLATLELYQKENTFAQAHELIPYFEQSVHSLKTHACVKDIRNLGLAAAIELQKEGEAPGEMGFKALCDCLENQLLIRAAGDNVVLSPPLVFTKGHIDQMVETLDKVLSTYNH